MIFEIKIFNNFCSVFVDTVQKLWEFLSQKGRFLTRRLLGNKSIIIGLLDFLFEHEIKGLYSAARTGR